MMIETLRWREEFNIEAAMNETYPDIFDVFGHLYGRDKEGRPIWYVVLSLPCAFPSEHGGTRSYNVYGRNNDLATAFSDVQRFLRRAIQPFLSRLVVD